jgi:hypothetical protein
MVFSLAEFPVPACSTGFTVQSRRRPGVALSALELPRKPLEQSQVAFLVAQDRDHHVLRDEIEVVATPR